MQHMTGGLFVLLMVVLLAACQAPVPVATSTRATVIPAPAPTANAQPERATDTPGPLLEIIGGQVQAVDTSARVITLVKPVEGFTSIALTDETHIVGMDRWARTLADIKPDTIIDVFGQRGGSNVLLAQNILIRSQVSASLMATLPARLAILDAWPLAVGTTWVYSVTVDEAALGHWTGLVTETITAADRREGAWVFQSELQGHPLMARSGTRLQWYLVLDGRVYMLLRKQDVDTFMVTNSQGFEANQVLAWPLQEGQQWGRPEFLARGDGMYVWRVAAQESVATLAGNFPDCYRLVFLTNPDDTTGWFCPGVGTVRREYHHHGSRDDDVWVLQEFHTRYR